MATGNEELAISPETLARDAQRVQAFSQHLQARVLEVAEAYEAAVGDQARAGSGQAPDAVGAGEGGQVPPG